MSSQIMSGNSLRFQLCFSKYLALRMAHCKPSTDVCSKVIIQYMCCMRFQCAFSSVLFILLHFRLFFLCCFVLFLASGLADQIFNFLPKCLFLILVLSFLFPIPALITVQEFKKCSVNSNILFLTSFLSPIHKCSPSSECIKTLLLSLVWLGGGQCVMDN